MQTTTRSSYSGQINWNSVYRAYYQIDQIVDRIEHLLPSSSELVFCGFGEVACRLSKRHSVHFIEFSEVVAEAARREFPTITKISQANILDAVKSDSAPVVLVMCRVSAYWQTTDCLERFLLGVKDSSRDMIAVDFFDADRLEGGQLLGNPIFSNVRILQESKESVACLSKRPSVLLATVSGSYPLETNENSFVETRAYYHLAEVLEFTKILLSGYDVSVEPPIIDTDPSFTLVACRKRSDVLDL